MIKQLTIKNFLGIASFDAADLGKTVLISGPNAAGKSSIGHAIRLAIGGELARVSLKKHASALVRSGSKAASIQITTPDGINNEVKISATGTMTGVPKNAGMPLACALDMQRFATMSTDNRRNLMMGMLAWPGSETITKMMLKRGCDAAKVEEVAALLMTSFAPAIEYAEGRAEAARRQWRDVTGEVYGEVKADKWVSEVPESGLPSVESLTDQIAAYDADLDKINQEIIDLKAAAQATHTMDCPQCGTHLVLKEGALRASAKKIEAPTDTQAKINLLLISQREIADEKNRIFTMLASAEAEADRDRSAEEETKQAKAAHETNLAWQTVIEAMSPSGIPSDLLISTVLECNNTMLLMSQQAGFVRAVTMTDELELQIGSTPYALASESEKWRMQAISTLMLAERSGSRIVVLDGLDVIEPQSRLPIINLAKSVDRQVVMMATLKAAPKIEGVTGYWVG
jgi:hypothetical protein